MQVAYVCYQCLVTETIQALRLNFYYITAQQQFKDLNVLYLNPYHNMKLLIDQPLEIQLYANSKIIMVFPTLIYFSEKQYIEIFLAKAIVGRRPKLVHYSSQLQQVLLITQETIEIFHTDWQNCVDLQKLVYYNSSEIDPEFVLSVSWDSFRWQVYGKLHQYSDSKCQIINVWETTGQLSCFRKQCEYIIQNKKLFRISHTAQKSWKTEIAWKQRIMAISNCRDNLSLAVMQNSQQLALCLGQTYILILKEDRVSKTIERNHIFYFGNDIIVSGTYQFRVDRIVSGHLEQLGVTQAPQGLLYAVRLFQQDEELFFLHYNNNHLMTKRFKLVSVQSPQKEQGRQRKSLHLSFDTSFMNKAIPQQANESGSQLLNPRDIRPSILTARDHKDNSLLELDGLMDQEWEVNLQASEHPSAEIPDTQNKDDKDQNVEPENNYNLLKATEDIELANAFRYQQSYQVSRKRESIEKQMRQKNMAKDSRLSNSHQNIAQVIKSIQESHPQFGNRTLQDLSQIQFTQGDLWGEYMKKTTKKEQQELRESNRYNHLFRAQKRDSLGDILKESSKVQTFLMDRPLTPELRRYIEETSYSELLMDVNQNQNTKDSFQEYLTRFLPKIILQKEGAVLLVQHVRTFNPDDTKRILTKLYQTLQDKQQNRMNFGKTLCNFRLIEVPKLFTRVFLPDNVVQILQILHSQAYMMDIIEPSSKIFADLLQDYMLKDQLEVEEIVIQDERVDITHPRNVFTVLLYLDQSLQIPLTELFSVYIHKILRFGHIDIIRKLIHEENVIQICQVPIESIQLTIKEFTINYLRDSCTNLPYVYDVVSLLDEGPLKQELQVILSIIDNLNRYQLIWSIDKLFKVRQNKITGEFLGDIIQDNNGQHLVHMDLNMLYRKVWFLQEDKQLDFYTFELVYLTQILAEKLMNCSYIYRSFVLLDPISSLVQRGFIAKLLVRNVEGKLINRLMGKGLRLTSLHQVFPEILSNPNVTIGSIKREAISIPKQSDWFSCSWENFDAIFENTIFFCEEIMKFVIYQDVELAIQMVEYEILIPKDFKRIIQNLAKYLKKPLPQLHKNAPSNIQTLVPLDHHDNIESEDIEDMEGNMPIVDPIQNFNPRYEHQKIVTKSLINDHQARIHYQNNLSSNQNNLQHSRARSDKKDKTIDPSDDQLAHLKLLVEQEEIIQVLRQIYQNDQNSKFIRALSIVQKQRLKIYHKDQYKILSSLQLEFSVKSIFPFAVFLTENSQSAFSIIKSKIARQIDASNFWVILKCVQIMFGLKAVCFTAEIFIRKVITFEKNDQFATAIKYLIANYQPQRWFLEEIQKQARKLNLLEIYQTVSQFMTQKDKKNHAIGNINLKLKKSRG